MLLKRIFAEKRALAIPIIVLLLLNVVAYAVVVYPLMQRSSGAADRATAAAASRRAAERDLAMAQGLIAGRTRAQEELATFYDKVLPQDFVAARTIAYTRPPALAKKANIRYQASTFAIDSQLKDPRVGRLTTRVVLQGDYENLRRFIYDLETSPEFIIVDSVMLLQPEPGKPLTFNLDLSTYYRLKPNAA